MTPVVDGHKNSKQNSVFEDALHYITLHYITLHYITLHYITLHYITLYVLGAHKECVRYDAH